LIKQFNANKSLLWRIWELVKGWNI
jgi:hypothetical protein